MERVFRFVFRPRRPLTILVLSTASRSTRGSASTSTTDTRNLSGKLRTVPQCWRGRCASREIANLSRKRNFDRYFYILMWFFKTTLVKSSHEKFEVFKPILKMGFLKILQQMFCFLNFRSIVDSFYFTN